MVRASNVLASSQYFGKESFTSNQSLRDLSWPLAMSCHLIRRRLQPQRGCKLYVFDPNQYFGNMPLSDLGSQRSCEIHDLDHSSNRSAANHTTFFWKRFWKRVSPRKSPESTQYLAGDDYLNSCSLCSMLSLCPLITLFHLSSPEPSLRIKGPEYPTTCFVSSQRRLNLTDTQHVSFRETSRRKECLPCRQ